MPKGSVAKKSTAKPKKPKAQASSPTARVPIADVLDHDLLAAPLLGIEAADGRFGGSLPEVLAALGAGEVRAFTALQAHQQHAWHAFLVQLAAIALHRAGKTDPRQSAPTWCKLLLALTEGQHEPWCLVVSDLAKAAFLQPPVPERTLEGFKEPVLRPDEIDVLVTSKNHDVKAARVAQARPEHWVYALVSLQTMEGYSGKFNYGIARMNSGSGSRPGIGLTPGLDLGGRFLRDVRAALAARNEIADARGYQPDGGISLVWLRPWDGSARIAIPRLDPLFIEVCRRVRLVGGQGGIVARQMPTVAERIASDDAKGNTGDPWTPIAKGESKAFTASEEGLNYRVLQRLLSNDYEPGSALIPMRGETGLLLTAVVMPRGQGKTEGLHQRTLEIPGKVAALLLTADGRDALARTARERVDKVATVRLSMLKPAILILLQGAPDKLNFKDDRADRWLERLDAEVDREFFERLWEDLDTEPDDARARWEKWLLELARTALRDAIESAPAPDARRYRCIASAERALEGAARKHLANAFPKEVSSEQ